MSTSPDHPVGTVQRGEKRAATDAAAADEQDDELALQLLRELLPALRSGQRNSLSAAEAGAPPPPQGAGAGAGATSSAARHLAELGAMHLDHQTTGSMPEAQLTYAPDEYRLN